MRLACDNELVTYDNDIVVLIYVGAHLLGLRCVSVEGQETLALEVIFNCGVVLDVVQGKRDLLVNSGEQSLS